MLTFPGLRAQSVEVFLRKNPIHFCHSLQGFTELSCVEDVRYGDKVQAGEGGVTYNL